MAENMSSGAGGFIVPSLPSPAPSATPSAASTASTLEPGAGLPHPRAHALRAGSAKEDQVRHWVSERLDNITRRFVKKAGKAPPGSDDVEGYKTMGELCADLESVVHIVWLSGTPNLQVPYLLNIASEFNTWAAGLPASPAPTFAILRKLDHCFASLLSGEDIATHEALPGFENGLRAGMSRTDMVRCKSTVERARFLMVEVMSRRRATGEEGRVTEEEEEDDGEGQGEEMDTPDASEVEQTEDEGESGSDWPGGVDRGFGDDDEEEGLFMDVARVYENTLVKLGETLGDGGGVGNVEMFAD